MFVQVIEAKVKDPAKARAALERWQRELAPKVPSWLGTTSGITADGRLIAVTRFESEQAARANSDSAAQSAWWNEFSSAFDGEATFFESSEIDTWGKGGSDDAGFVQVMVGTSSDRARMQQLDKEFEAVSNDLRPDVIGGTTAWDGDRYVSTVYFTSEAEAREGEKKTPEGDAAKMMEEMGTLMGDVRFIDLTEPILLSP